MIVRALGWGQRVGVVQFIKGTWKTGERQFFANFEGSIDWHTMGEGFTWDTQDLERDTVTAQAAFSKAREMLESGDYDLVVLDEINIALRYGYLAEESRSRGPRIPLPAHQRHSHRAGREARPVRVRRSSQRDARREAPFRRGDKGGSRHRLLAVPIHESVRLAIDTAPAIPTMPTGGAARRAAKREPGGNPGLYPQL